ncbi:hypothetical protein EVAR_57247_1 [Eumeta japonica]|uniref:Uncharacterized protein n=1 Tax=Eumeta variegata TaxID=151549 RepID=A0A4C1YSD8_EUMVA|nr:hypothetical protein EVAR_57247_1 [Eumeta japonica]
MNVQKSASAFADIKKSAHTTSWVVELLQRKKRNIYNMTSLSVCESVCQDSFSKGRMEASNLSCFVQIVAMGGSALTLLPLGIRWKVKSKVLVIPILRHLIPFQLQIDMFQQLLLTLAQLGPGSLNAVIIDAVTTSATRGLACSSRHRANDYAFDSIYNSPLIMIEFLAY